jgi:hypothetical protein
MCLPRWILVDESMFGWPNRKTRRMTRDGQKASRAPPFRAEPLCSCCATSSAARSALFPSSRGLSAHVRPVAHAQRLRRDACIARGDVQTCRRRLPRRTAHGTITTAINASVASAPKVSCRTMAPATRTPLITQKSAMTGQRSPLVQRRARSRTTLPRPGHRKVDSFMATTSCKMLSDPPLKKFERETDVHDPRIKLHIGHRKSIDATRSAPLQLRDGGIDRLCPPRRRHPASLTQAPIPSACAILSDARGP